MQATTTAAAAADADMAILDEALAGFEWQSGHDRVVRVGWKRLDDGGGSGGGEIGVLLLARPRHANAWNDRMWRDWDDAVRRLAARDSVRAVVLLAAGPVFTGGLDLASLADIFARQMHGGDVGDNGGNGAPCPARERVRFHRSIAAMQASYSALEAAPWPVIAAVHGACVGAGVDLVTACDLRYAAADAFFQVKEVDVGITADLGTLQRLPAIVGQGVAADMALTARRVTGAEAASIGLVAKCFGTRAELLRGALAAAAAIAAKSPLAVWGTKRTLLTARDGGGGGGGGAAAGLERVALHNAAFLVSADIGEILRARSEGRAPRFSKL